MSRQEFETVQRDAAELTARAGSAEARWHLSSRAVLETNRWRPDSVAALATACRSNQYHPLDRAECCAILLRAYAIALDVDQAWQMLDALVELGQHAREDLIFDTSVHWLEAFTARKYSGPSATDPPPALKTALRTERLGSMLSDLETARLMVAMRRREPDVLDGARRLFRRCCSEGFLDREAFSSLLLARARREAGQSLTSQHILMEIRRLSPRFMQNAIELELLLLGVDSERSPLNSSRAALATRNRDAATQHARHCLETLRSTPWFDDVRLWIDLFRLNDSGSEDDEVTRWRHGKDPDPPRGILDPLAPRQAPWIVCNTEGPNERELTSSGPSNVEEVSLGPRAAQSQRALSLLALAPTGGVPLRGFAAALGASSSERGGAMRVLLHRLRGALRGVAKIEETGERLVLLNETRWCFRESHRGPSLADRVLMAVVEATEPIGSKRIAIDIGASVRAVQNELQILAEDRMCRRLKVGREVMYSVEDTTFKAPTQERWLRHSGRD